MKRNTKTRSFTLEHEGNSTDIKAVGMPDAQERASACFSGGQQTDLPSRSLQNCAQKLLPPQELRASISELKTHSAILTGKSSQEQKITNFEAMKNKYCDHSNKHSLLFPGPSQIRGSNSRELKYHPMALTGQSSHEQNPVDCEIKKNKMYHFHPYKHSRFTPDIRYGMDSRIAALSCHHPLTPNPMPRLDPITRLPICQCAHLDLAAMNAYQIARLPFSHPWFSMPMMPSLSAISMPGDAPHQHRASPHYAYCQCFCCLGSWRASKPNLQ
nr:uncharacterized protein LOC112059650 [Chrysemys picta bellii]